MRHDFDLVFHRHLTCGKRRANPRRGNLPVGKSSGESGRGTLQLARQCMVGRSVAGVRSYLLFQVRAATTVLNAVWPIAIYFRLTVSLSGRLWEEPPTINS